MRACGVVYICVYIYVYINIYIHHTLARDIYIYIIYTHHISDLAPMYSVLEYIFEVLVFMEIKGHVLVLMLSVLRFYEYMCVLFLI